MRLTGQWQNVILSLEVDRFALWKGHFSGYGECGRGQGPSWAIASKRVGVLLALTLPWISSPLAVSHHHFVSSPQFFHFYLWNFLWDSSLLLISSLKLHPLAWGENCLSPEGTISPTALSSSVSFCQPLCADHSQCIVSSPDRLWTPDLDIQSKMSLTCSRHCEGFLFVFVCLLLNINFLALQNAPDSFNILLAPVLELVIFPRSPDFFFWKMVLKTKRWC